MNPLGATSGSSAETRDANVVDVAKDEAAGPIYRSAVEAKVAATERNPFADMTSDDADMKPVANVEWTPWVWGRDQPE